LLLVLAGVVAAAAFATPPSDQGPYPLDSVPDCVAAAPDTGGAHICKVHPFAAGVPWQAGTGEWVVIRGAEFAFGTADDHATCLAIQASLKVTITIDGNSLPVDNIPCAFNAAANTWITDWRALSHPLPKGAHAIVETLVFTTAVDSIFSAGDTITANGTLTVSNPG
jgi:hypothetical protein